MHGLEALPLVGAAVVVAGLARRLGWSPPLVLVLAGLAVSFVPHAPAYVLDPDVVLFLILPPLLFSAAWESSYIGFRANLRPILLLSVGLVLFTALTVGLVAAAVLPDLPLAAAFALGAIVAPPDAVAATAIGRALGLPRRLLTILAGESLVNDATALTAYGVAVAAATGGAVTLVGGGGEFVLASAGGLAVGGLSAFAVERLLARLHDPLLENTTVLLVPFLCYFAAEHWGASGVLAVVVAGLYLGHQAPRSLSYATRLEARAIWNMVEFLLESVVFALIGLQLRAVLAALSDRSAGELTASALAVTATVILARFAWVVPVVHLPGLVAAPDRSAPSWRSAVVVSWAGMRGVVSLAAAFALPLGADNEVGFPQRDLVVFLSFCVVVATLLVQGLTLPWVIRRLGVVGTEASTDALAEASAQHYAARAAIARLDELRGGDLPLAQEVVDRLRERAEMRALGAWERLGGGRAAGGVETPSATYRRLRREMLEAERAVFVRLRDDGTIDDEVLRRVQHELDLEEAMLARD